MRNSSLLRLKYTCFYLCQWELSLVRCLGFFRPYAATEGKPYASLADLIRCCFFTEWLRVTLTCFAFCSLYFTVCKNRYTHSLIIPQYSVGSSAVKKAKCDGSLFNFFCRIVRESFQYFQVAKVSDLILLFSRFLIEVLHSSKTTVLCCRILTFWSNLALNIVSTARNDLCFTLCFGSHFESGI